MVSTGFLTVGGVLRDFFTIAGKCEIVVVVDQNQNDSTSSTT